MRQRMEQLLSDLYRHAEALGVQVTVSYGSDPRYNLSVADMLPTGYVPRGTLPAKFGAQSTYYPHGAYGQTGPTIELGIPRDFTPAWHAAILAHELGHHLSRNMFYPRQGRLVGEARYREEVRASYLGHDIIAGLTGGRVPNGCFDLWNTSMCSYAKGLWPSPNVEEDLL